MCSNLCVAPISLVCTILIGASLGCGTNSGCQSDSTASGVSVLEKPAAIKAESAASEEAAQSEVAGSLNDFAFDLHRQLAASGNLVYSPFSIDSVLSMTLSGARGATSEEMARVLRADGVDDYHAKLGALSWHLAEGEEYAQSRVASDLWIDQEFEVEQDFEKTLVENYGASVRPVDFDKPSAASDRINQHISRVTGGHIDKLMGPDTLEGATPVVLTNAVYLDAKWSNPFDNKLTYKRPFHLDDGESVSVDMMSQKDHFFYTHQDGVRMILLPYEDSGLMAVGILPVDQTLEELEARLDAEMFSKLRASAAMEELEVALPRMRLRSTMNLRQPLAAMGMPRMFDAQRADFSGMSSAKIYVSQVRHAALIEVNEAGTVAAAAATVEMAAEAAEAGGPEFIANRPFLFLVVDRRSDAIVFAARVANPAEL